MKGKINEDKVVNVIVYILLAFIGIVTLYPFYYTIICSFNDGLDLMKGGVYLWPRKFTLSNYELFIGDEGWRHAFFISVARTVVGTVLCTGFTSMFSYALSRNNLMFKKGYRFLVIFTMYFSGGLIPYYVLLSSLGLMNTFFVYVVNGMVNTFFVMTGINFFASIPESMIEAAKIDGAREIKVLTKIVLPVSKPFLATLALFAAVGQWNSWLDSAYYVRDASLQTLSFKMMTTINQTLATAANADVAGQMSQANTATSFTVQATAMAVSMIPIMCVYPFLQKYFVQGMMIGAVKE
ncbi:carbohydrate ABC transporter permease [Eisenbergiella porci]|uniref:carbohydrate ABC transporter permease n=1 Tax=Eisenbergiella porci TaxID=2652274 RepID=UPI002A83566A|nr:carbohydrate ABC transporter permease [Eisenbergiella porci]